MTTRTYRLCLISLMLLPMVHGNEGELLLFQDSFSNQIKPGWSWRREHPQSWRLAEGGLQLRVLPGNMWGGANDAKNVLIRPVPLQDRLPVEIHVTVHHQPTEQYEQVDLVWYYDDSHMVKIGQEIVDGQLTIVMGREEKDKTRTIKIVPLKSNTVTLSLRVEGNRISGRFRTPEQTAWEEVGSCDLPVQGSPSISLQAYQGPSDREHWATLTDFRVFRP